MAYVKYEDILVYVETKTASMIFADNIAGLDSKKVSLKVMWQR
jgi:hypothetical protein